MGQAKQRREVLRKRMLAEGAKWDFEPSSWEESLCAELSSRTPTIVRRAAADQLSSMRMPTEGCHANVRWYVENDPSKAARAVAGWWLQWPDFVLHSVIEDAGQLICITPQHFDEDQFPFIPDPEISWVETGDVYSAVRDGQVIGPGVRAYPAYTMVRIAIVRDRLLAGVDPSDAVFFSDEQIEALKREHVDRVG